LVREGKPYPPQTVAELEILPGVEDALRRARELGFLNLVITNQPDVARGKQSRAAVEAMHMWMRERLAIDDVLTCFHDDSDDCGCRKPRPGLITQAASAYGLDLTRCFVIGDRWRDIDAGATAGCRTILIDYGYQERGSIQGPDARVGSLGDALVWIERGEKLRSVNELKVKLFADGADKATITDLCSKPHIKGFTTNPTLMRKAGITDYAAFAREILDVVCDKPVSFEVFADEFDEMERQARKIASWADNVYVKIPVTNTKAHPSLDLICRLSHSGVRINATALMTLGQVRDVVNALAPGTPACVSVFAGRIADTGRDPVPIMQAALELVAMKPDVELIWASPREVLNIFQADRIGCHIITVTNDVLKKLEFTGKDLDEFSLETVTMFYADAVRSGYTL
jgi:transaldolase